MSSDTHVIRLKRGDKILIECSDLEGDVLDMFMVGTQVTLVIRQAGEKEAESIRTPCSILREEQKEPAVLG